MKTSAHVFTWGLLGINYSRHDSPSRPQLKARLAMHHKITSPINIAVRLTRRVYPINTSKAVRTYVYYVKAQLTAMSPSSASLGALPIRSLELSSQWLSFTHGHNRRLPTGFVIDSWDHSSAAFKGYIYSFLLWQWLLPSRNNGKWSYPCGSNPSGHRPHRTPHR